MHNVPVWRLLGAVLIALVSLDLRAATPPQVAITAGGGRVTATGVTPGGEVVLVVVSRERHLYVQAMSRRDYDLTDTDNDGTVSVDNAVTEDAVWCAVDVRSGSYATTAAPGRFPLKSMPLPHGGVTRASNGQPRLIDAGRGFLEALLVKPHVGAWVMSAGDGSRVDADGQVDGRVSIDPSQMQPLGQSPPAPHVVTPGDTLILIDPYAMEIFASEVRQ